MRESCDVGVGVIYGLMGARADGLRMIAITCLMAENN